MIGKASALKSIFRVGLKAALPLTGDVLNVALDEGAKQLINQNGAQEARAVEELALKTMTDFLEALSSSWEVSSKQVPSLQANTEHVLKRYGLRAREWPAVRYDASRARMAVTERAAPFLRTLSTDEEAVISRLVEAFYLALLSERETILSTDLAFRQVLLTRLDSLEALLERPSPESRDGIVSLAKELLLGEPARPWRPDRSPPGALLRAEYGVVPFHGRVLELSELAAWCESEAPVQVRVYTGPGGIGKTRLLLEGCQRRRDEGWTAGFLAAGANERPLLRSLFSAQAPLFVVIDYAETRRDLVRAVLSEVHMIALGTVRVVLLARAADDWWNLLKQEGDGVGELVSGPATDRKPLRPLSLTLADRRASYDSATNAFASTLGRPVPEPVPDDLGDTMYGRVLLLHMRALTALEGMTVEDDQGILDHVLQRERRFWREQACARGLPGGVERGIGQAMAVFTLGGGATTRTEAADYVGLVPLLRDQPELIKTSVADLLHEIYPGERWVEPLMPDLLGEHLIQVELDRDPTGGLLDLVFGRRDSQ